MIIEQLSHSPVGVVPLWIVRLCSRTSENYEYKNPMKRLMLRNAALALVCYVVAAIAGQAQSVFQVVNVPGLGAPSYFEIGADTGLFQIDDASIPSLLDNTTAHIATPARTLTFSIGVGTPCIFSYDLDDPFPDPYFPTTPHGVGAPLEISGEYFSGSFQSSPDVYADLLAGDGQFQVGSGASSPMEVIATPEPRGALLFIFGLMLLIWRRTKPVCQGLQA